MSGATQGRRYHHGDLRRALLDEAVRAIAEEGAVNFSLRDLARRVGVSHAAPAHHFGDKTGLLTAVAAEGFRLLADELCNAFERTGDFVEVGVAYVHFTVLHRPYFEVMFRLDLHRMGDPELVKARNLAGERVLELAYGALAPTPPVAGDEILTVGTAAWSLVHGLATLSLNGSLPAALGNDREEIARSLLTRLVAPGRRKRPLERPRGRDLTDVAE